MSQISAQAPIGKITQKRCLGCSQEFIGPDKVCDECTTPAKEYQAKQ